MAAQGERESGVVVMCSVLGPMAQDIPEQDIVMGELELPPQMDPKPEMGAAAEAAVYDTSPSPPHKNPPPIPAETVRLSAPDMAQLFAIINDIKNEISEKANRMEEKMEGNTKKMEANIKEEMKEQMKETRDEMPAGGQKGDAKCCDQRAEGECTGGRRQGESGDVSGDREGYGDGNTGEVGRGDGDVHEGDETSGY